MHSTNERTNEQTNERIHEFFISYINKDLKLIAYMNMRIGGFFHNGYRNTELRNVDDVDSDLIRRMAERVAEGKLSVREAAQCAEDFNKDGCSKAWCLIHSRVVPAVYDQRFLWYYTGFGAGECKTVARLSRARLFSLVETAIDPVQNSSSHQNRCQQEFKHGRSWFC